MSRSFIRFLSCVTESSLRFASSSISTICGAGDAPRVHEDRQTDMTRGPTHDNGYNAWSRSVLLRRLSEHAGLEHLVPPLHALGAEAPDLLIGEQRQRLFADVQRGDSEEGTGQGQPHSSLAFCTCIQPELRRVRVRVRGLGLGLERSTAHVPSHPGHWGRLEIEFPTQPCPAFCVPKSCRCLPHPFGFGGFGVGVRVRVRVRVRLG